MKLKFILIAVLTSFAFWIPIFSLFMESRAVSTQQVFLLLTVYSFAIVLLEYPTGVFGDLISHKMSVLLGFAMYFMTDIAVVFISGTPAMFIFIFISALSMTFVSGSDAALRFSALKESFKRDYPVIKISGTIATLIGISLGPVLYQLYSGLPFIVNGICFGLAFLVVLSIPAESNHQEKSVGNAFALALKGIKSVGKSTAIQALLIAAASIGTLAINMKWIYPTLFTGTAVPVTFWGILITSLYLARMVGTFSYKKCKQFNIQETWVMALLVVVILALGFSHSIFTLYPILFLQLLLVGLLETSFEIEIQHNAEDAVRASVLSLSSLTTRLISGLHIALLGFVANKESFLPFALATSAILLVALGFLVAQKKQSNIKR
jgi:MFS family permease